MRVLSLAALAACAAPPDDDVDTAAPRDTGAGDTAAPCAGLVPEVTVDGATGSLLQGVLDAERDRLGAPGVTLAVRLPDGATWVGASGVADADTEVGLTLEGSFGIGSITKTFVAAIVLHRVADGTLSLSDPLDRWYPDVPGADVLTVDHLLTHTTGLRDYTTLDSFLEALAARDGSGEPIDATIAEAAAAGPVFPPTTAFGYSNTNYFVLGRILERETGEAFADLLATLTAEVGLDATYLLGFDAVPACAPAVSGHLAGDPTFPLDPRWQWASGGVAAPVGDLLRWGAALLTGDVLDPAMQEVLRTRPDVPDDDDGGPSPYGHGLRFLETDCGSTVGHTGSTMGYQSDLLLRPDGTLIAVLQNDFLPDASEVAWAVCRALDAR